MFYEFVLYKLVLYGDLLYITIFMIYHVDFFK